jgi:hypothetical protein
MTNWGRVYYTNLLSSIVLVTAFPLCKSEHAVLAGIFTGSVKLSYVLLLVLSCLVGVCMSHVSGICSCGMAATGYCCGRSHETPQRQVA